MSRRAHSSPGENGAWTAGRPVLLLTVLLLIAVLAPAGPAWARRDKTVFHGLATDPETGLRTGATAEPIVLSAIGTFEGFEAPLAGDPVPFETRLVASDRSGRVASLDPAASAAAWHVDLQEPIGVGPAIVGEALLQASAAGALFSLDARDGRRLWRSDLGGVPLAPPIHILDRLLQVTDAPELVVVRPEDGAVLGRLPLPGRPLAPSVAGSQVIVGTDHGMVLAIEASTLTVRWRRYLRHPVTAPPLAHDGRVYVALADRSLHCLRLSSGRPRWRQRTGSITGARLVARADLLYALCYDNDIYLFRPKNGHLVGRVRLDHRLILDGAVTDEHLFVAPFTEGTVVGLAFPFLGIAGRFSLESPGEWFTTRPVVVTGDRLAVGYGRDAGRILFLSVAPGETPAEAGSSPGGTGSR